MINGVSDHVHILASLPRTIALSKYIENIKRTSSKWIKSKGLRNYSPSSFISRKGAKAQRHKETANIAVFFLLFVKI